VHTLWDLMILNSDETEGGGEDDAERRGKVEEMKDEERMRKRTGETEQTQLSKGHGGDGVG
jgi:hypothetical protein